MQKRYQVTGQPNNFMPEEFPHPKKEILQVLKGTTSEPIETVSQKPGQEGNTITLNETNDHLN